MAQKNIEGSDALIVKETVTIEDGLHKGDIKNLIRETRKDFDYVDLYVELTDVKGKDTDQTITLKTGFPASISEKSSFGRLLIASGLSFKPGDSLEVDDIKAGLLDRCISFQTMTDGDFSNIINKTIKFEE